LGNGAGGIHSPAARSERVVRNQNNYRISPADGVGAGSPKEKCRANLAAIKLVRKLQAENRPATQEEKSALVRYVGWGGLPQIFNPATDWQAESRELIKLISKEEFRLARASTLNAHYTSGEIIQGIRARKIPKPKAPEWEDGCEHKNLRGSKTCGFCYGMALRSPFLRR
jgi:hypothetical protein